MKKPDPINKVQHEDEFSSGLMEAYGRWMGGDTFQNTQMPDLHLSEAPFDGMTPQSNGAEIEQTSIKKKEAKKPSAKAQLATKEEVEVCEKCGGAHPTDECPNILKREEFEIDGEIHVLELIQMEGSMAQARDNVGASTCWKGYKAKGTKKKGGKVVPNCVKAGDEVTHEGEELEEAKRGLYANIHAKRKRGEAPAKPGDEDYPAKDAFKKAAKTAKKEEVEYVEEKKKLDPVGKEDGDVDNDGDKDSSDSYLLKRRAAVSAAIKAKKGTKKEGYSDWRTELIEKDVKGVEVNPSIDDATDPMSVFDKNKKLKGADKAVKEECGSDDDGSEKALAKKATKVKRVKYQDGVTESLAILRANIDELKSRYL